MTLPLATYLGPGLSGPGPLGLRSGFEPPDLDRPGRLPHPQGLCEARLGYRDDSPQLGPRDPSQVNDPESSE